MCVRRSSGTLSPRESTCSPEAARRGPRHRPRARRGSRAAWSQAGGQPERPLGTRVAGRHPARRARGDRRRRGGDAPVRPQLRLHARDRLRRDRAPRSLRLLGPLVRHHSLLARGQDADDRPSARVPNPEPASREHRAVGRMGDDRVRGRLERADPRGRSVRDDATDASRSGSTARRARSVAPCSARARCRLTSSSSSSGTGRGRGSSSTARGTRRVCGTLGELVSAIAEGASPTTRPGTTCSRSS